MNCCAPTSVTFAAPTTAPSSTFRQGGEDRRSRSSGRGPRVSSAISTAERHAFRPQPTALLPRRGIGRLADGGATVRGRRWRAHHPRHPAIPGAARVSPRRHRRRPRPRRPCPRLRHTFATELANADVSVYTLMKLLGHESMVTSQRYVTAAGTETRTAAAQNKLYGLLEQER